MREQQGPPGWLAVKYTILPFTNFLTKKGGIGRGGWVSARGAVHMAAALTGCRKALVGTGWAISLLDNISGTADSFELGELKRSLVGDP